MTNTNANSFRNKLFIVLILTLFLILLPAAVCAESDPEPPGDTATEGSSATSDASDTPAATEPSGCSLINSSETNFAPTFAETTSSDSETPSTEPAGSQTPPEQPSADLSADGDSTESSSSPESNTSLDSDPDTTSTEAPASESDDNHIDEPTSMQSNEEQSENESAPAADDDCYVVELDVLDIANVNTEIDLQFTFAEVGDSSIGEIDITVPADFIYVDGSIVINAPYATDWSGIYNSGSVNVSRNSGISAIFKDDDPISILFRVITPATANDGHEFTTAVKDADGSNNDMHESSSPPVVNVRDGSEPSPFEIGNASQLDDVRNYLNGNHFIQIADIDLGVDGWADGEGWVTIGNNSTNFTGNYNGNGQTISNLTINRPATNYQGLFGYTSGATIEKVSLQNVDVRGNSYTGALAGRADSSIIEDVHVTGTVTGAGNTGGLVGYRSGGHIHYCSSDSTVTGGDNSGGLVGFSGSGQIYSSYSTGAVHGAYASGGLVGILQWKGNVDNCYSLASVEGTNSVGGLVGYAGSYGYPGYISGSYSAGLVTGTSNVGGLLGNRWTGGSSVTDSYWDTEASKQETSVGGTRKTTAQMMQMLTYASWDISAQGGEATVWRIVEGSTYPMLRHFFAETATITVSAENRDYDGTTVLTNGSYQLEDGKDPSLVLEGEYRADCKNAGIVNIISGVYSSQKGYDLVITYGTVDITALPITVTAVTETKVYDGTTDSAGVPRITSANPLIGGDTVNWTQTFATRDVGTSKTLTPAGTVEDGNSGNNYSVTFVGVSSGVITALPITVTAVTDTKVYDGITDSAGVPTITSVNNTLIGGDTAIWTQTFATRDVGTGKTITPAGTVDDGNNGNNYDVTFVNDENGEITVLSITVTAVSNTRVYDGTTNSSGEPDITTGSLVGEDTVLWTQTYDTKDVGTGKIITPAGAVNDGNSGNNYAVTFVPVSTGEINVKPITIAPDSGQSKISGDADPVFTYQHTALIGDDQIAGALGRVAGEELGNYAYTLGGLSVSSNYNLLMTANPASFSIVEQPLEPDPNPDPDPTPDPDPVPNPDPDSGFGSGFDFTGFPAPALPAVPLQASLTLAPAAPLVSPGRFLVLAPEGPQTEAAPLVTPEFVRTGSPEELAAVLASYEELLQYFDENWETMSESEYALALLDLAAAWAAIQAVEASLNGEAADLDLALEAYLGAIELLAEYGALLDEAQLVAVEAILEAVADVLTVLGVDFSQPGV